MRMNLPATARIMMSGAVALLLAGTLTAAAATQAKVKANNWIKQCTSNKAGKKICLTATNLFISKPVKQRLVGAAIRTEQGQKIKAMLLVLPLGTFLTPGFTMKIDKGEAHKGVFTNCRRDGCHAQFQLTDAVFNDLRKGTDLNLIFINHKRQKLNVAVPLAGFSAAFDGPASKLPPPPKK